MNIKYRLYEYKWLKENIQELEDRLLEIDTMLQKATSNPGNSKVQTTKDNDKWTDLINNKIIIENKINSQLERMYKEMSYIEDLISCLPEREKKLMRLRYIDNHKWEEICVEMGYSWKQIHRIHANALMQLKNKILKDDIE
jgi:RNA polymerase sigma factor (sigma-70 family)